MIQKNDYAIKVFSHVFLMIGALMCLLPFAMLLSISFTDEAEIIKNGFGLIPRVFSISAYKMLFQNPGTVLKAYGVTTTVTVCGTILSLVVSTQFAYTLSRKDFFLKKFLSGYLLVTMLFNGGLVPTYILISRYLNLKNNLLAILLPGCAGAWNIFVLKSYLRSVPLSIIEAAKIDGANELYIFYRIVVPMVTSGIATIGIFVALSLWNEWYNTMLYITDPDLYSLQYLLQMLLQQVEMLQVSQSGGAGGLLGRADIPKHSLRMATCAVAIGPIIFVFLIFQKYFISGITIGAVKE